MAGVGSIPPGALPISARAPGKCILFGEHAVVHGAPELLFALDLHTQVVVRQGARAELNGDPDALAHHPYLRSALENFGATAEPFNVRSVTRLPRAAGLGSSAAFVVALAATLAARAGGIERPALAQRSFEIERGAQGVGSPGDTSASVAGGFLTVNGGTGERLWTVQSGTDQWDVRRLPDPGWVWVLAYSGIPRSTADAVRAVSRRFAAPGGPEALEQFAEVARAGIAAVLRGDRTETAALLRRNHELLREAGVSHPRLEELLRAAAPVAEGGKLTGAGLGGSIVVLPIAGRETELMRRLARAGAVPFAVRPAPSGVELVDPASLD